jgi:hypothetical protein
MASASGLSLRTPRLPRTLDQNLALLREPGQGCGDRRRHSRNRLPRIAEHEAMKGEAAKSRRSAVRLHRAVIAWRGRNLGKRMRAGHRATITRGGDREQSGSPLRHVASPQHEGVRASNLDRDDPGEAWILGDGIEGGIDSLTPPQKIKSRTDAIRASKALSKFFENGSSRFSASNATTVCMM